MTGVYVCECEHPKSQHKRERGGCRALDCDCAKFDADMAASAAAQGVDQLRVEAAVLPVLEAEAAKSRAALGIPAAEVRDAELLARPEPERHAVGVKLVQALREREQLAAEVDRLAHISQERDDARGSLTLARAELASAKQEIEQVREARGALFASYEVVAGQLAEARTEIDNLRLSRDLAEKRLADVQGAAQEKVRAVLAAPGADLIGAPQTRYLCESCGARYGVAYEDHPCGQLTPITVTTTRQGAR